MIKNKTHKLIITAAVAATLCVGGSAYFLASANNTFANNGANTEITAEEAKKIALDKAGEGYTIEKIEIDKNLFNSEYELELKNNTYEIDVEIDASTGKITKWDIEAHDDSKDNLDDSSATSSETTSSQSVQASNNNTSNKSLIGEIKAKEITLAKAGSGYKVTSIGLDRDDEALDYDIELTNGTYEIDAELDAYTGNILKWEKEKDDDTNKTTVQPSTNNTTNKSVIGESKAKQIALNKAGSGYKVTNIELDEDDGRLVYELELVNGNYEISAEINAGTGAIIEWDRELED
ncbi:PepSY domain-containing protein [Alloiococcus sp. CFN-8]|uniref:PepSY domain-containing protein n=1 Tax=Alloiococcus sp. CFN-8 TaxID=3416081 RepID=UPI003CEC8633